MGTSLLGHPVNPPNHGQTGQCNIQAVVKNKRSKMHIYKGYNDKKMTHTMILGPITSWSKNLLWYKTKSMVMDVVAADKTTLMEEEKDGPSKAMLRSILLLVLHV